MPRAIAVSRDPWSQYSCGTGAGVRVRWCGCGDQREEARARYCALEGGREVQVHDQDVEDAEMQEPTPDCR